MDRPSAIRSFVRQNLPSLVAEVNKVLPGGTPLHRIEEHVAAVSRKGKLPPWFAPLALGEGLPSDGKSLGTVVETLFAATLKMSLPVTLGEAMEIRAAKGVDIPSAGLGIKSPSENLCVSDPFVSPYQRLLGQPHDTVVLLTDYQSKKTVRPLIIQVTKSAYYRGDQMADRGMCEIAKKWRRLLSSDDRLFMKLVRFLAHSNQGDIQARKIVSMLRAASESSPDLVKIVASAHRWAEGWGAGGAHWPTEREWHAILASRLDGKCGLSDARQWRCRFAADLK